MTNGFLIVIVTLALILEPLAFKVIIVVPSL